MTVVVVTDSTSALPEPLRTARGSLTVLGIPVLIDGVEYREGEDIGGEVIVRAIREGREVTTSGLPPEELRRWSALLLGEGASGIVLVHLSGRLSGTVAAAEAAAAGFGGRVAVVDSLGAGMGVGYPALAALEAAEDGAALLVAAAAAQSAIGRTSTYFYLDTLEYLRRGGRISAARAIVGTALSVKPILGVEDGRIDVVEKVRTPTRGLQRLAAALRGGRRGRGRGRDDGAPPGCGTSGRGVGGLALRAVRGPAAAHGRHGGRCGGGRSLRAGTGRRDHAAHSVSSFRGTAD